MELKNPDTMEEMEWDLLDDPTGEVDNLTGMEDLKQMLIQAAAYKSEIEELESKVDILKKPFNALCESIQKTLELMEVKKMSAQGYDFKLEEKASVKTPKTIEEKQDLWKYLESIGLAWEIFSVNSSTLQSTYKALAEKALQDGDLDFELPGVGKSTSYTTLKIKKGK